MRITPTESDTFHAIMDYLAAEKIFALRLNTGAGFVGGRPIHHHSGGKGVADIVAFYDHGYCSMCGQIVQPMWIEVKSGAGRQSPEQKSFQEDVRSRGHIYILARSVEDVITVVTGLRK